MDAKGGREDNGGTWLATRWPTTPLRSWLPGIAAGTAREYFDWSTIPTDGFDMVEHKCRRVDERERRHRQAHHRATPAPSCRSTPTEVNQAEAVA